MFKKVALLLLILSFKCIDAQITLTHNIGNKPIKTDITSCEYEEYWARTFTFSDFGISTADQFIINSAQIAISNSYDGAQMIFNFYSIDSNFPNSTPKRISYGNAGYAPLIGDSPEIVQINFSVPIVIPAGIERILVEVIQGEDTYNPDYTKVIIAGTEQDNDISWFKGCRELYTYTPTENLSTPVPNANFFINVTGEKLSTTNYGSSVTLTHNVCDDVIETGFPSCSSGMQQWARVFYLNDFGISENEEFVINSGQIGISGTGGGATVTFHIYEIDNNFPDSFSESNLIGSSREVQIPFVSGTNNLGRIFEIEFDSPVKVDPNVEGILVVAQVGAVWGSGVIFIAGTEQDYDHSWFRGCVIGEYDKFTIVNENLNFFINVSGDVNHITNSFEMNI